MMPGHIVFGLCVHAYSRTYGHDPIRRRASTLPSVLAPRFKPKYSGLGAEG